jgi:hypothetical protein
MNFNNLDGYMFEELIVLLLKKMEFSVEQTSLSGDGGVDIIAYSQEPIIRGKYLIQCKNWNNPVGQPVVRDLFGVVMGERANKGILITTSNFTEQARQFASDKNIELIENDTLIKLLTKYNLNTGSNENNNHESKRFTDVVEFNNEKYSYLKSKVENNRTEKMYYENLRDFYHQYIISQNYEININGLIDEYIKLNNEIIRRFCRKSAEKISEASLYKYTNAYLLILKGDIFNALEIYNDLGLLTPKGDINISPISYKTSVDIYDFTKELKVGDLLKGEEIVWRNFIYILTKGDNSSPILIIKNLYLLFHKYNYQIGIDYINALLLKNFESIQQCEYDECGNVRNKFLYCDTQEILKQIKDKNYNKFHIPLKTSVYKNGNREYELCAQFNESIYIPIEDLINVYYLNMDQKISDELEKSKILLDIGNIS